MKIIIISSTLMFSVKMEPINVIMKTFDNRGRYYPQIKVPLQPLPKCSMSQISNGNGIERIMIIIILNMTG